MSSHHQTLRSVSIVGGAAAINIAIGLIRTKIAALLLGPLGIGEIGLLLNFVQFVATVGALGLGTSAVRQIANALGRNDHRDVAAARRALYWLSLTSSFLAAVMLTTFAGPIGRAMSFDAEQASSWPWLSVAVAATILSGVSVSLLIGYSRVAHQAMVQIGGAALGTFTGLSCLLIWGKNGVVGYTILAPVTQLLLGLLFALRLPPIKEAFDPTLTRLQAGAMIKLGIPFTIGALSMTGGLLALRSILLDRLGPLALGEFTAAWTLCVTYVGFVLQATSADYFPRLSAAMSDRKKAHRIVTEQFDVSILISLPFIVGVQGAGPWLLHLLYSSAFAHAIDVVRLQVIGDLFKIAAMPIAYIMLATGRGKTYWFGETLSIGLLISITTLLIGRWGLAAAGTAYIVMNLIYFMYAAYIGWDALGFTLSRKSAAILLAALIIVLITTICSTISPYVGLILGGMASVGSALFAIFLLKLHDATLRTLRSYIWFIN